MAAHRRRNQARPGPRECGGGEFTWATLFADHGSQDTLFAAATVVPVRIEGSGRSYFGRLAGIYPLGMKMIVQWVGGRPAAALGWLVGMLTLGTAMPHLLRASDAIVRLRIADAEGTHAIDMPDELRVARPEPPPADLVATVAAYNMVSRCLEALNIGH